MSTPLERVVAFPVHRRAALPRRYADVLVAQLAGLEVLNAMHRSEQVRERQLQAAIDRTDARLRETGGDPLEYEVALRALIAHSQPWFVDGAAECLLSFGIDVVGRTDNGAEAVGIAAAEQPDLALLGEELVLQPCEEVIPDVRAVSPTTLIGVQGHDALHLARLARAGADLTFGGTRPEDAAMRMVANL